jgi:glycosyltransferase involved in cell wall biosynthesis
VATGEFVKPTVSIVIPCYNAAKWLHETLECCLNQAYPAIELIVVDDGSTDGSLAIIQSYADRLRFTTGANRGGCHARNQGLAMATGDYIMFLDADDLIEPDTIAALIAAFDDNTASIAACAWSILLQDGDEQHTIPQSYNQDIEPISGWLTGHYIPCCSILWLRSLVLELGGWDESLTANQDGDLMLRALLHGAKIGFASSGHAYYRHVAGHQSVSHKITVSSIQSRMRVLEKVENTLIAQGQLADYALAIGQNYHGIALVAFGIDVELGRICDSHAKRLAGQNAITGTFTHRLLCRLIGLEAKERLARLFQKFGLRQSYQSIIRQWSK